jgi:restriction system protein
MLAAQLACSSEFMTRLIRCLNARSIREKGWRRCHSKVDEFASDYQSARPAAIIDYCRLVLEQSNYPAAFPKAAKVAYAPESKQLVVEYDCPTIDVVPEIAAYKYTKSKDEVTTTPRPTSQRRALYASVIAQLTLRTLHELFAADCWRLPGDHRF